MSRIRTRNSSTGGTRFWNYSLWINNSLYESKPWSSTYKSGCSYASTSFADRSSEWMQDVATLSGGHPYNPCLHKKVKAARFDASSFSGGPYYFNDGYGSTFKAITWSDEPLFISPSASYYTQCMNAIAASEWVPSIIALAELVKGLVNSKSLLAVSLRELPQTIRMVKNPFGLLKHDWRKRAGKSTAAHLMRTGSNLWLEAQYGWRATYKDFQTFCESGAKYMSQVNRYRKQASERYSKAGIAVLSAPSPTVDDATVAYWKYILDRGSGLGSLDGCPAHRLVFSPMQVKTNVSCYATDQLERQYNAFTKLVFAYGLSADKLLETIWEMTPYSFVVDWFVNMSRIISLPRFEDSLRTLTSASVSRLGYSAKAVIPFTAEIFTRHANIGYWYSPRSANTLQTAPPANGAVRAGGEILVYQRTAGMPPSTASLFTNQGLSVSQGVSGFSLLFQRIFKR